MSLNGRQSVTKNDSFLLTKTFQVYIQFQPTFKTSNERVSAEMLNTLASFCYIVYIICGKYMNFLHYLQYHISLVSSHWFNY